MTRQPRIAALIADGFQEEECLVPRFALQLLGARVDMVSSTKASEALCKHLWQDTKVSPFEEAFSPD
jgi:putative intracellular protease/amidase